MSSRGRRKQQHRLTRIQASLLEQRNRLQRLEEDLRASLASKTTVYLDTNHWINLRHVILKAPAAKPEYAELLSLLEGLVSQEAVCCPVSSSLFEELMRQDDTQTRLETAKLMDRLSSGVCLQFLLKIARREWRHHVWKVVRGHDSQPAPPVWTAAGFWAGQDVLLFDVESWVGKPDGAIEAWTNLMWSMGFADVQALPNFMPIPNEMVAAFIESMNNPEGRTKMMNVSFEELRSREKLELLHALKDDFFQEPLPERTPPDLLQNVFVSFVDDHDPWVLPSLQVHAGIFAAIMRSNRIIDSHDALDFTHAASAIPYCDALFCDRAMAALITSKPLELGKLYDTVILSRPDEMVSFLKRIGR